MRRTFKLMAVALVALTMVALTGCKKDENKDKDNTPESQFTGNLVGQWLMKSCDGYASAPSHFFFYADGQEFRADLYVEDEKTIELAIFTQYTYDKDSHTIKCGFLNDQTVTKLTDKEMVCTIDSMVYVFARVSDAEIDNNPLNGRWSYKGEYIDFGDNGRFETVGSDNVSGVYQFDAKAKVAFIKPDGQDKTFVFRFAEVTENTLTLADGTVLTRGTK